MFKERLQKCFGYESMISLPASSSARAWLDITQITEAPDNDIVLENLLAGNLCYGHVNLSPEYFKGVLGALCKGELLYLGFDIDCKYFVSIYQGEREKFVFFWIPTDIQDTYQVYQKLTMKDNQKVVGNLISILKRNSSDGREN